VLGDLSTEPAHRSAEAHGPCTLTKNQKKFLVTFRSVRGVTAHLRGILLPSLTARAHALGRCSLFGSEWRWWSPSPPAAFTFLQLPWIFVNLVLHRQSSRFRRPREWMFLFYRLSVATQHLKADLRLRVPTSSLGNPLQCFMILTRILVLMPYLQPESLSFQEMPPSVTLPPGSAGKSLSPSP